MGKSAFIAIIDKLKQHKNITTYFTLDEVIFILLCICQDHLLIRYPLKMYRIKYILQLHQQQQGWWTFKRLLHSQQQFLIFYLFSLQKRENIFWNRVRWSIKNMKKDIKPNHNSLGIRQRFKSVKTYVWEAYNARNLWSPIFVLLKLWKAVFDLLPCSSVIAACHY